MESYYAGKYYRVMYANGGGYLVGNFETVEQAKTAATDANRKAVKRGYNADTFIITRVEWSRAFDANGFFQKDVTIESAVGIY